MILLLNTAVHYIYTTYRGNFEERVCGANDSHTMPPTFKGGLGPPAPFQHHCSWAYCYEF